MPGRRPGARGSPRRAALIDVLGQRFAERGAQELLARVMRGDVTVDGQVVTKPGTPVRPDADIRVQPGRAWVSRGGAKLDAALERWALSCRSGPWIDAGSSTGGFTDCLLRRGAPMVYAVDVGVGQLDWRLRGDPRVRVREGTNIMDLGREDFDPPAACAAADLSFRSLRRAARHILGLTTEGWGVFLVKPQFEYANAPADFHGVVRRADELASILSLLRRDLAAEGVSVARAMPSPVAGRRGNRELLWLLSVAAPWVARHRHDRTGEGPGSTSGMTPG